MNLCSSIAIRALLEERGLKPRRGWGQNFLVDRNILDAILDAAEVGAHESVLEIGPGLGVLTEGLLARAGHVTAVEKDIGLHGILAERWGGLPNLTLLNADALTLDYRALFAGGISCMVSNLPYSVGTRVVAEAVLGEPRPARMLVMLQAEVAERFVAPANSSGRSALSIWLQQSYEVRILRRIKPGSFWPRPDVMSALVSLKRHDRYPLSEDERRRLVAMTRLAFEQRRKQMASLFAKAEAEGGRVCEDEEIKRLLERCGARATARAEELELEQWCALARLARD